MTHDICRWGFLGAADIARKNWHSVALAGNSRLVAVASRDRHKAEQFISDCCRSVPVPQPVEALGSYDELLQRADIDAVYVPLPTAVRRDWVIRAADAGKHVLVEKPCGVSAADVQTMIDACRSAGVQFMDGVMFLHSRRLPAMREVLDDPDSGIGAVRHIFSQFSFAGDDEFFASNIRGRAGLEPAGCLGDLGWYTIALSLWVMRNEMPVSVRGRLLDGVERQDGQGQVPVEFLGELEFAGGVTSTFFTSFRCGNSQPAVISGTNGYLQLNDFVLPFFGSELSFVTGHHTFTKRGCLFHMEERTRRHSVSEYSNNAPDAQEVRLFRRFSDIVISGNLESHWPELSLRTQRILDAALESAADGSRPVSLSDIPSAADSH